MRVHPGVVKHEVGLVPLDCVEEYGDVGQVFLVCLPASNEHVVSTNRAVSVEGAGVDVEMLYLASQSGRFKTGGGAATAVSINVNDDDPMGGMTDPFGGAADPMGFGPADAQKAI